MGRTFQITGYALLAIAVMGASAPRGGADTEQQQAKGAQVERRVPRPIVETGAADRLNQACDMGQDDRQSDLCAQWKAADAAEVGALWTRLTAIFTGGGVAIALLTLLAAVFAVKYARDAANQAKRGAEFTRDAVEEAKISGAAAIESAAAASLALKQSSATTRAWVYVAPLETNFDQWRKGLEKFVWPIRFVNHGNSPALIHEINAGCSISDVIPAVDGERSSTVDTDFYTNGIVIPFHSGYTRILKPAAITEDFSTIANRSLVSHPDNPQSRADEISKTKHLVAGGVVKPWLIGWVRYSDVFGEEHITRFCYALTVFGELQEVGGRDYNERT